MSGSVAASKTNMPTDKSKLLFIGISFLAEIIEIT